MTHASSDEQLFREAAGGNPAAFDALVRRHFTGAYAIALAHTRDHAMAEDVCQDAFFRAYQGLAGCREPARFGAWLYRIVRNQALNTNARERIRHPRGEQVAEPVAGDNPASDLARRELGRALLVALGEISPVRRQVVLLHDLEGWSHGEIADVLGISEVMSRRHLSDARRVLRTLLPALGEAPHNG